MFTFDVVLRRNKKLEKLPKLEISEQSVLEVRMGKIPTAVARDKPIRFKDLGYRTREKLEKQIIVII